MRNLQRRETKYAGIHKIYKVTHFSHAKRISIYFFDKKKCPNCRRNISSCRFHLHLFQVLSPNIALHRFTTNDIFGTRSYLNKNKEGKCQREWERIRGNWLSFIGEGLLCRRASRLERREGRVQRDSTRTTTCSLLLMQIPWRSNDDDATTRAWKHAAREIVYFYTRAQDPDDKAFSEISSVSLFIGPGETFRIVIANVCETTNRWMFHREQTCTYIYTGVNAVTTLNAGYFSSDCLQVRDLPPSTIFYAIVRRMIRVIILYLLIKVSPSIKRK